MEDTSMLTPGSTTHAKQKKFLHNFNLTAVFLSLMSGTCHCETAASYNIEGNSIKVTSGNQTRICRLDVRPTKAVDSHDGSALMVTDDNYINGYIPKNDLINCSKNVLIHVRTIPDKVGSLSDINL